MAKGFTPIIGLAVVVALAMAAVFGAMSLTNPAFAAVGVPADAELAERTFSPQEAPAPGGLDAEGGINKVTVSWNFVSDANIAINWEIQWARESGNFAEDDWRTATTEETALTFTVGAAAQDDTAMLKPQIVVTGLNNNITYKFAVRRAPTAAGVPGKPSATVRATPAAPPDPGDNLVAEAGVSMVTLIWDRDDGGNATSWQMRHARADEIEIDGTLSTYVLVLDSKDWTPISPTFDDNDDGATLVVTRLDGDRLASGLEYVFQIKALAHDTPSDGGTTNDESNTNNAAFLTEADDVGESDRATPMPAAVMGLEAEGGDSEITLSWNGTSDTGVTMWMYRYKKTSEEDFGGVTEISTPEEPAGIVTNGSPTPEETAAQASAQASYATDLAAFRGDQEELLEFLENGNEYTFEVWAVATETESARELATATPNPIPDFAPMFVAQSNDPGKGTRYDLRVQVSGGTMNTLTDELVIELEDFDVPGSIGVNSIAINVDENNRTTIPEDVSVSGEKIFIIIGDQNKDRTGGDQTAGGETADFDISTGSIIHVVIRQSAGVKNPTETKTYGPVVEVESARSGEMLIEVDFSKKVEDSDPVVYVSPGLRMLVPTILDLDEEDGGLGTVVVATGKGFRNDTSLTVFVDLPSHQDDDDNPATDAADDDGVAGEDTPVRGTLDLGEDVLCEVDKIGKNDIGTCKFTVSHPTFSGGDNYINAVDGRNNYVRDVTDLAKFELTASIAVSPESGSPGEIILIQVVDFPRNSSITRVQLGRLNYCGANSPDGSYRDCPGQVDSTGSGNFKITVPNWARAGIQELKVFGESDTDAATNVDIGGPRVQITPETVLANQRVSLVGVGFSAGENISQVSSGTPQVSKMSIGGEPIAWSRINGGQMVTVDSGGNWSASVDLPLEEATTGAGERVIRITDSGGRSGTITVTVAERTVTITPEIGRVGTQATVRGKNFPSKNDDGSSFNVEIIYDAGNDRQTTVSAVPDASGNFEVPLRIPSTASIPSTNTVKVQFEDDKDITVVTTVAHDVPEGSVTLSQTSGSPGSTVTVSGFGFKNFVPIRNVKVGSIEVTPLPVDGATSTGQERATDSQGMLEFNILIPGLDVGIQTVEVNVGQTTASTGFTLTASGVSAGDITASAKAVENMGTNFVRAFNFNNDTKTWTFYDPAAGDASTLENFITGESYWILIMTSDASVILNNKTRNLTCVDGNCWNLIVW